MPSDSREPESNSDSENASLADRGRDIFGEVRRRTQEAKGTFTGANVADQVAEYSELYTQVLLGLHRDLQSGLEHLEERTSQIEALQHEVASLRKLNTIVSASLIIAVVSLGVAIWSLL